MEGDNVRLPESPAGPRSVSWRSHSLGPERSAGGQGAPSGSPVGPCSAIRGPAARKHYVSTKMLCCKDLRRMSKSAQGRANRLRANPHTRLPESEGRLRRPPGRPGRLQKGIARKGHSGTPVPLQGLQRGGGWRASSLPDAGFGRPFASRRPAPVTRTPGPRRTNAGSGGHSALRLAALAQGSGRPYGVLTTPDRGHTALGAATCKGVQRYGCLWARRRRKVSSWCAR